MLPLHMQGPPSVPSAPARGAAVAARQLPVPAWVERQAAGQAAPVPSSRAKVVALAEGQRHPDDTWKVVGTVRLHAFIRSRFWTQLAKSM